jgi:hypothetical protein
VSPSRPWAGTIRSVLHPTNHLELALLQNQRWVNVDAAGISQRVFLARVSRLKSTYTFTARTFVRLIGQYEATRREPSLYLANVGRAEGSFLGSVLFAYKVN